VTGFLRFSRRVGNTLSAPVISFADDAIGTKYNDLEIAFDATHVVNRATVTGLDNKTATDNDLSSQATYFVQAQDITNSLLHQQGEIDGGSRLPHSGHP
jgi:hypothetical protein